MNALFFPRRRTVATAATLAALALTSAGCGGGLLGDDEGGDDSGPIVLGMLAPTSGSSAAIGPYMSNGAQLAVDEINAEGGIDGREIELAVEDEACDPKTAVAGANKLVSKGIDVSIGGYCSGATLPTLPIFDKADVPMIIPAANSSELVDQKLDNVFLINGTGEQQAEAAATYMATVGATKVALMDDNTSYSADIANRTEERLAEGEGPEVVATESVTAGESDYGANVSAVLGADPDLVYWTGYYQEGGLIIRQLRQAGFDGTIMVADGSVDAKLLEIAGEQYADGVLATMTQTPDTIEGAEGWVKDYAEKFDAAPGPYSTQSYDAVRLAAEAIKQAESTEAADIIEALESIDGFEMFSGPLKFTDEHTLSSGGFQILKAADGKFTLEDPLS